MVFCSKRGLPLRITFWPLPTFSRLPFLERKVTCPTTELSLGVLQQPAWRRLPWKEAFASRQHRFWVVQIFLELDGLL